MHRLIVTNGDGAVAAIGEAGVATDSVLPWSDVLFEGPVREHPAPADLREERARYLSSKGYGTHADILESLVHRDELFEHALLSRSEIILWFEHDLYDQLQLLQVLDRVANVNPAADVQLVCRRRFIGEATPGELAADFGGRQRVGAECLQEASDAWSAFVSPTPVRMAEIVAANGSTNLPFLGPALERLLQELPDHRSGLSRTQRHVLDLLHDGPRKGSDLFVQYGRLEQAQFMGDWSFWSVLIDLGRGASPLCSISGWQASESPYADGSGFPSAVIRLTDAARAVLSGARNAIQCLGLDRWLGATHLTLERYWTRGGSALSGPLSFPGSRSKDEG